MASLEELQQRFGPEISESTFRDNRRVFVPAEKIYEVLAGLKQDFGFDQLIDVTAVDYLDIRRPRIGSVSCICYCPSRQANA